MVKFKNIKFAYFLIWLSLLSLSAQSQEALDADQRFLRARELAFADRWAEARKACFELLAEYPDYYDAMMLIGRTYAWEQKTDSARMMVLPLLDREPDSHDVLLLLAYNELWADNHAQGLQFVETALLYYPTDQEFIYLKAYGHYLKGDNDTATAILLQILSADPHNQQANQLLTVISAVPEISEIDRWYAQAEDATRAGNFRSALDYSQRILDQQPDHYAAKLLKAHNLAFMNDYNKARELVTELDREHPNDKDVMGLMVNIEIWDNKYKTALTYVNKALAAHPEDEDFLYQKALIEYHLKDYNDALRTLDDDLLIVNPEHEEGLALKELILNNHRYRDYVFLEEYFEGFNVPYKSRSWITSTGFAKWTKHGTYIGKVNAGYNWYYRSEEFERENEIYYFPPMWQFEAEAYQNLFPTNYLWLNYAYSPMTQAYDARFVPDRWQVGEPQNVFFPLHRGGAEFFQRLPHYLEASLGMRFMHWKRWDNFYTTNTSYFWTASLSWTPNLNYWSYRIFLAAKNQRTTLTHILTYRRYFSPRPEYFFVSIGWGNHNDDFAVINYLPGVSFTTQVGIHKFISPRWFFLATLGYANDARHPDATGLAFERRHRFMASAGVRYYFNLIK
jgi:YaiO family outer membrane protein